MADLKLWATTRCPGARVKIYASEVPHVIDEKTIATTDLQWGVVEIKLYPRFFALKPEKQQEMLFHEYVHAVEYLNDPEYLSPEFDERDGCTLLAQTLQAQLWPLMRNFKRSSK